VLTAEALRADGQRSSAAIELETALGIFERLGAAGEAAKAKILLHAAERSRATRTLMFTDIVDSTKLVEVLGDDAWGSALAWHDRILRQCFQAANGRELSHEGDGFFVSFLDPGDAIDCAIAIQRALATHRIDYGFAPQLRIGLHTTETVDLGDDLLGMGVHEAARVGSAAGAGEILATAAVLDAVGGRFQSSERRPFHGKGLDHPLDLASVYWK
jgi:class 3 adenylate cyclase